MRERATPDSPPRPRSGFALLDTSVLQGLVGGDDATVAEFLGEFLSSLDELGKELDAAPLPADRRLVGSVAHRLKASSRAMGALPLGDACARTEDVARTGSEEDLETSTRALRRSMVDVAMAARQQLEVHARQRL